MILYFLSKSVFPGFFFVPYYPPFALRAGGDLLERLEKVVPSGAFIATGVQNSNIIKIHKPTIFDLIQPISILQLLLIF